MEGGYIPALIGQICLTLLIILANFCVVFCIVQSPTLRHKLTNFFVLAIGIVGILAGILVCPLTIVEFIWPGNWNQEGCLMLGIVYQFVLYASIGTAMLIAIDRQFSIVKPMFHAAQLTLSKTLIAIALTGTFALTFALYPSLEAYTTNKPPEDSATCYYRYSSWTLRLMVLLICFVFPFSVIIVMYVSILQVAWQAQAQITPNLHNAEPIIFTIERCVAPPPRKIFCLRGKSTKAGKTLLLIVTVYSVVWTPHFVCNLMGNYSDCIVWITLSSFVAHPVLYGVLNRAIREQLRQKFACWKYDDEDEDLPQVDEDFWQFLERTTTPSRPYNE